MIKCKMKFILRCCDPFNRGNSCLLTDDSCYELCMAEVLDFCHGAKERESQNYELTFDSAAIHMTESCIFSVSLKIHDFSNVRNSEMLC